MSLSEFQWLKELVRGKETFRKTFAGGAGASWQHSLWQLRVLDVIHHPQQGIALMANMGILPAGLKVQTEMKSCISFFLLE